MDGGGGEEPVRNGDRLMDDHQRLTDKFQGLGFKLTGVEESRVVREILA